MPVAVELIDPRVADKAIKQQLKTPGQTVTVIGLTTGASASVAALRWTNPQGPAAAGGRGRGSAVALRPEAMEILALDELPHTVGK